MKRVFVIHGWGGTPHKEWFPWIKEKLSSEGYEVHIPEMPDTDEPGIKSWVSTVKELVGKADEDTFFVGHSIGCLTILHYIQGLGDVKVGGVVMVAPWTHLLPAAFEKEDDKVIATPWLETPIDWKKIKTHTDRFVAIFSDNDPCVPLSDSEVFNANLGARIIVEHKAGHFCEDDGATEVPVALKEILNMIKSS